MDCPVCGCMVDVGELPEHVELVTCDCCGVVWIADREELHRILVGPED